MVTLSLIVVERLAKQYVASLLSPFLLSSCFGGTGCSLAIESSPLVKLAGEVLVILLLGLFVIKQHIYLCYFPSLSMG